MNAVELDAVADELYGLVPGEFTAARDARAVEARRAGDRELAAAIAKLRRPTRAAWLVNALVRARPDQAAAVARLGASLRDAQERLDGAALRQLAPERTALLATAAREARVVAAGAGEPATDEMVKELQATIEAALADAGAAEAVQAARLVAGLTYSGLGTLAGAGSVSVRAPRAPAPRAPAVTEPAAESPRDRKAVERAAAELAEAESAAEVARRSAEEAERLADETEERIAALESELAALRSGARAAGRRRDDARRALRSAEDRHRRAAAALSELEERAPDPPL